MYLYKLVQGLVHKLQASLYKLYKYELVRLGAGFRACKVLFTVDLHCRRFLYLLREGSQEQLSILATDSRTEGPTLSGHPPERHAPCPRGNGNGLMHFAPAGLVCVCEMAPQALSRQRARCYASELR